MVGKGGRGLVRGVSNLQGRSYRGEFSFPNWELARLVNWNSIRKGWPGWRSLLEGKQLKNDLNLVSCRKSSIEHWYLTKRHKNCEWCPASGLNDFLDSYIFSFFFCCRAGDPYWQSRYWQLFWIRSSNPYWAGLRLSVHIITSMFVVYIHPQGVQCEY